MGLCLFYSLMKEILFELQVCSLLYYILSGVPALVLLCINNGKADNEDNEQTESL